MRRGGVAVPLKISHLSGCECPLLTYGRVGRSISINTCWAGSVCKAQRDRMGKPVDAEVDKSKRKRFRMKLEVEHRDFMHWVHRAFSPHYKHPEEPCMGTSKCSWFMPVSAVHMCLEYLINSTDVALCLLTEGLRDRGRQGKDSKKEKKRHEHYK